MMILTIITRERNGKGKSELSRVARPVFVHSSSLW
jgi:hypothetical protein